MKRALLASLSCLVCVSYAVAAPLTAYQQKIADEITAGLDQVDTALAGVKQKLSSGDAAGASRDHNTATRSYNNHIRRLSQLPADEASVVALRQRAETLGVTLKETADAIRTAPAKAPDAAKPNEKPQQPDTSRKLDYRDEEKLKNVRFYLNEVEPRAKRVGELTRGTIDAQAIAECNQLMAFARQRMQSASETLATLPADHPDVAAQSTRFNALLEQFLNAQTLIEKAAPAAQQQVDGVNRQREQDLALVDSWSGSLNDPQHLFHNRPDDAIALVGQLPQMREATTQMLERWRAQAQRNDASASAMVTKLEHVQRQLDEMARHVDGLRSSLPASIKSQVEQTQQMIDTAVTEKRPLYFAPEGGIAQQLAEGTRQVKMLTAIDPQAGADAQRSLDAARAKSIEAQAALAQDIINGNKKPAERYAGEDIEALRERVIAAWKEKHPDAEIVAVIFNTEGWTRTTRWDWNRSSRAFHKVDYEHLQPKLFYKFDDTHAVSVPIDLYKDQMQEGRLTVSLWEKEAMPAVTNLYLLTNLK